MRHLSRALNIGGGILMLVGLVLDVSAGLHSAQAQPLPPRPTTAPTTTSIPPTPAPQPTNAMDTAAEPAGRITGTVIDQTTGAPAPGIAVVVGDVTVNTDANGNYNRTGLPAGNYVVALALAAGQGVPAQGPGTVTLTADATVVQHLFFRSQPAASPLPSATAVVPAARLPQTGGSETAISSLWILLGLGMLVLGGGMRIAQRLA